MNKIKGLTIDHVANTVVVSKDFAKRANNPNSTEYKTLRQLRQDGFSIENKTVIVKSGKKTHKGLTVAFMEQYINEQDNRKEMFAGFNKVKRTFKGHPAYYAKLKEWFLDKYPAFTVAGMSEYLTIDFMDNYVGYNDNYNEIIDEYNNVKAIYEGHPAYLTEVKNWFLKKFPEVNEESLRDEVESERASIALVDEWEAKKAEQPTSTDDEQTEQPTSTEGKQAEQPIITDIKQKVA